MMKRAAAVLPLLFVATASLAQSDVPNVPLEFLQDHRHLSGDSISFCINVHGLAADFDRALATELANALLLKPTFYDIDPPRFTAPMDYRVSLEIPELYIFLTGNCDAFMGWPLSAAHLSWTTFSRPYYDSSYVFVSTNKAYQNLSDVPPDHIIGTRLLSSADTAFATYINSLPKGQQWKRAPYLYDKLIVDHLLDGSIDVGMVWEPTLNAATGGDLAGHGLHILSSAPFAPPNLQFSIIMRERETFVRTNLDGAIVQLIQDGTIANLLKQYNIPGKPSSAEDNAANKINQSPALQGGGGGGD